MDFTSHAPRAFSMRLGHDSWGTHMRPVHLSCGPCIQKCGAQASFPAFILGKARTFSPNPGRNSYSKY